MCTDLSVEIASLEQIALSTPGVIGIAEGLSETGKPCIKLLVNTAIADLTLPKALKKPYVELQYIGKPKTE